MATTSHAPHSARTRRTKPREPSPRLTGGILSATTTRQLLGDVSAATLWRMWRHADFPKPVRISKQRVGWRENEVRAWIAARANKA